MPKKLLFASVFTAFTIYLVSCSENKETKDNDLEKPIAVTVTTASIGSQNAILASGQVEAAQTANISTRVMGRINRIFVKTGDKVSKGQLLATISDDDIRARRAQTEAMIAESEAAFANAKKDYDRFEALYKQQSATAKELDNVTLQYNAAKARVEAAKQMRSEVNASLSYSSLVAPFSGVVTQKLSEEGSLANPGMPILTVEQSGILQVSATVSESDIAAVHLNDVAQLEIKSTGKTFEGKIIQLNPSAQFTGGQYIIKVSIPESAKPDLFAGMFVNVKIPLKDTVQTQSGSVTVPLSAIVNRDELTGIYTVSSSNTALLRWVRLGRIYSDRAEVVSGLSANEKFIAEAEGKLYNGAPVVTK
ncbi:MAG: efflux RND transporter periplasmic adaptor subunit [Bacteroidetes bacterium]|nr:efflux RND transporter periplasmic adaptor subunit [Bacteroidota bacterium]